MSNRTQSAPQSRTTTNALAGGVGTTRRSPNAAQARLSAEHTEGVIMRMAAVLSADAAKTPAARKEHVAYINGALSLAASLGVLPDDRALAVRRACLAIFDSAARPGSEYRADPAFAAMVSAVRAKGGVRADEPLAMAQLEYSAAIAMIGRLMAAGIIGGADATGFHPVIAGEC